MPPPKRDQRPLPDAGKSPQASLPKSTPIDLGTPVFGATAQAVPATPPSTLPPLADGGKASSGTQVSTKVRQNRSASRRFHTWVTGAFVLVSLLGAVAGASAISLLRIPNLPNCRAIFWPLASASARLQCADAYAAQGSVESLLAAISLVEALPPNHPLRGEINERVETWASQILTLADRTFQEGKLEEAIAIVHKIPSNTAAADEVNDRIAVWRKTWEQAESIFRKAEQYLRQSNFQEAFLAAVQLRSVENEYWANQRYEELVSLITQTRQDINTLAEAERLADGGTVENVVEALAKVMAIKPESYAYDRSRTVLKDLSRRLLDLAEVALKEKNSSRALEILGKVPAEAKMEAEIADFRTLIDAYELAGSNTVTGLESALVRLQSLGSDRPLYAKAQELKALWQKDLEGLSQLNWAQQLANPGTVDNLVRAISEAEKIKGDNPRWSEAQDAISRWRRELARVQDQPILDRAKLMAVGGDRGSLQAAIAEAETIEPDSVLYAEAQAAIGEWRWQVQQMDNEPLLEQARRLASAGDLTQAVAVASQIPAGQAVYDEAQQAIAGWKQTLEERSVTIQARQTYQQALGLAQAATVDNLVSAISLVQTIPETSADWTLAQQSANQWSWDVLQAAEAAAIQNPSQGIAIASRIPPRTEAYAEAQLRIRDWQRTLPSPIPTAPL